MGVAGELKGNSSGFRNLGMIWRMSQKDAGAAAIHADVLKNGSEVAILRGVAIRNTNDLETVGVNFFVAENANTRGFDSAKILAVVAKLLVIPGDKINALGRGETAERLGGATSIDGRAVVKIAGNENGVGFLFQNLCDHAPEKTSVAHVAEVNVADEGGFAPAPGLRKISETNGDARDASPTGIEYTIRSSGEGGSEEDFDEAVKIQCEPSDTCDGEHDPREHGSDEQETK